LADLTPEELVACVDFRYVTDALTPDEALDLLRAALPGRREREAEMLRDGFPAYTTSAGRIGYAEASLPDRARAAVAEGFTHPKGKAGGDLGSDLRRARLVRHALGPEHTLRPDAN